MKKYCLATFLFWLFGGWWGLHHFYLGRDKQGFLWATSCGGFIVGWLKDFSSLARYTEEANEKYPLKLSKRPSVFSEMHRMLAMLIFSLFYRTIVANAVPTSVPSYNLIVLFVAPVGTAFGAYMVSNVSHISLSYKYPLIAAYVTEALFGVAHLMWADSNIVLVCTITCAACLFGWRERQEKIKMTKCKRFGLWFGLGLFVMFLLGSYGYHNAEVYVEELDGNVKLSHVFRVYFASEKWAELKQVISEAIWIFIETGDFEQVFDRFSDDVAKSQVRNALRVLGFNKDVEVDDISLTDLKTAYKLGAKKWHPDKVSNPEMKEEAQNRFMEIKEAHELLERMIKRRMRD